MLYSPESPYKSDEVMRQAPVTTFIAIPPLLEPNPLVLKIEKSTSCATKRTDVVCRRVFSTFDCFPATTKSASLDCSVIMTGQ